MTSIAFFAHDENDAAIRRRVTAFELAGYSVKGFAMRRREKHADSWAQIDLGRTYDGRFVQRWAQIFTGAKRAAVAHAMLAQCDVVYARNLDMLLCATMALRKSRLVRPLVYECLDIHRLMHRRDAIGAGMRFLERRLLKRACLLVVSSPAFLREYFDRRHTGVAPSILVENRLAPSGDLGPRPAQSIAGDGPLRIGWFGVLRCARSLALLEAIAARFGSRVEIVMRGYPDLALPDFHTRIHDHSNMRYLGRYRSPDDLGAIYEGVDVVWAGDFHDPGFNSRWLLPNRIYEGGYFATPAIAPEACETGAWIAAHAAGFTIGEPPETSLSDLIARLIASKDVIAAQRANLLRLPATTFVQPQSEMRIVIERALARPSQKQMTLAHRKGVAQSNHF